ncbi:hypothetical protein [Oryzibacter oryziterrae]|uniref:hypothetical protein n=1 Tax=Oryzibacter oryziterrae TaxID=2766474 RepID=UPI001F3FEDC1|nr:hypothetical protein [Oryzibacter oryziterrae]
MSHSAAFTVVESLCASGKGSEDKKEDRLVVTDDFVAVVDGATSSGPINGKAGGIVAAECVVEALLALPADATARAFVDAATARLAARMHPWPDETIMRPSAAVVVWNRARQEVWRIGDCHYRIDQRDYAGEKEIDKVSYAFRCAVVKARIALGVSTVEAERRIPTLQQPFMPLVSLQHAFLNKDIADPLAYGAICGTPVPDRFIEVTSTAGAGEFVLCSDGFLSPAATLADGLADLARIRDADPLMVTLTQGSRPFADGADYFDDTTYVRVKVG